MEAGSPYKVVFLGTPDVAANSLKRMVEASEAESSDWNIVAVVSQPARLQRKGKGEPFLQPTPVGEVALDLGIKLLDPENAKDETFLEALEEIGPDLCITAAYGNFLPRRFLNIPKFGTLNIHPSLLPRWRGAAPVPRSLEAGDEKTGVSLLWTVLKMDAGPVAAQVVKDLDGSEKAPELLEEMFEVGTEELIRLLPKVWSGELTIETSPKQDESLVTAANKLTPEEAQILDFKAVTATTIYNRLRGFDGAMKLWFFMTIGEKEPLQVQLTDCRVVSAEEMAPLIAAAKDVAPWNEGGHEAMVFHRKGKQLFIKCAEETWLEATKLERPGVKQFGALGVYNIGSMTGRKKDSESGSMTGGGSPIKLC